MVKRMEILKVAPFFVDQEAGERVDRVLSLLIAELRDKIQFEQVPAVKLTKAAQTITTSTGTILTWNAADFDYPGTMFDNTNDTIVIPDDGIYWVHCSVRWSGGGFTNAQRVELDIQKNSGGSVGVGRVARANFNGEGSTAVMTHEVHAMLELVTGDTLDAKVFQNAGANRQVDAEVTTTTFSAYRINPQR